MFGFWWLGRWFFYKTAIFGSKAAPAQFDHLPETLVNITCAEADFPTKWVHRQLDDVPATAPRGTKMTEKFGSTYTRVCADVGVPLANLCPEKEKAFGPTTEGVVVGIWFNLEQETWNLPTEKAESVLAVIEEFLAKKTSSLREAQKLHGLLNSLAMNQEFAMGFRYHLSRLLDGFARAKNNRRIVTEN